MGILIGMDEAGYGPHLGPLAVAATAWHLDEELSSVGHGEASIGRQVSEYQNGKSAAKGGRAGGGTAVAAPAKRRKCQDDCVDLYRLLRNIVSKSASERRIAIADSKALYSPAAGLRNLERGLHAVLQSIQQPLTCWSSFVRYCEADPECYHARVCWPDGFNCTLPVDATSDELARLGARFSRASSAAGVRPLAIRAKLLFPQQFNELVAYYNSKGAALSHITVGLLRELMDLVCPAAEAGSPKQPLPSVPSPTSSPQPPVPGPQTSIYAVCDKHGGRNFYTALLQHHFSEHWIAPVFESHAESHYEWGPPEARVRVVFRMNGERFLPTALASMTAKYLRELSMRAFNEFWCARVPNLRPTAGYYRDAWRFKSEIEVAQRKLGIDDHLVWRNR